MNMIIGAHQVHSIEDAFLYLAECQLATVQTMAGKKSIPKAEYRRQVSIAQHFVDWVSDFKLSYNDRGFPRLEIVLDRYKHAVHDWKKASVEARRIAKRMRKR